MWIEKDDINCNKIISKLNYSTKIPLTDQQITFIRKKYLSVITWIIDNTELNQLNNEIWSKIEPLLIVDENDNPIINDDWTFKIEFRENFKETKNLNEKLEFCRIVLFILEDRDWNIIVSKRSMAKPQHPWQYEIAWGHVIAWKSYLETVYKEVKEELNYNIPEWWVTVKNDFLFKYKNYKPKDWKWNIIALYRVNVDNIENLNIDENEIENLVTFSPEELYEAITTWYLNWEKCDFAQHHAYWYLEYLEKNRWIDTKNIRDKMIKSWVMDNRTKFENL